MSTTNEVIAGCGGSVTMPGGFEAKFNNWKMKKTVSTIDTTGFVDGPYADDTPTRIGYSGSASGFLVTDAAPEPGPTGACSDLDATIGEIVLTAASGKTYTMTAVISDMSIEREANGKATVSFDFKSKGATVVQAWS